MRNKTESKNRDNLDNENDYSDEMTNSMIENYKWQILD